MYQAIVFRVIHRHIIGLATKRLQNLSIPANDKLRNRLVANPILRFTSTTRDCYYAIKKEVTELIRWSSARCDGK